MGTLYLTEQTAPGTPGTGKVVLYPKSDGFFYGKDDGGTETRVSNTLLLATAVASTSGTSIDFTGLPTTVQQITITFVGVSTNGTSNRLIQIGDSGGIETSGYLGSGGSTGGSSNYTTGWGIPTGGAANTVHGAIVLTLVDAATFTWVASGTVGLSDAAAVFWLGGSKSLTASLDRVRITTVNGTDTYDAGTIGLLYQ